MTDLTTFLSDLLTLAARVLVVLTVCAGLIVAEGRR